MDKRIRHGAIATIGYLLSPLSWWNDLFINIPIAFAFGTLIGLVSKNLFFPAMIAGYWITNLAGFLLLHYGVNGLTNRETQWNQANLRQTFLWTLAYTLLAAALVHYQVIRFPTEYFQ